MGKWLGMPAAVALLAASLIAVGNTASGATVARSAPVAEAAPSTQVSESQLQGIMVSAEANVVTESDIAYVSAGFQADGATAQEAQSRTNEGMQKVIAAIKAAGIAETDIKTVGLDLSPTRDNQGRTTGYRASNSVRVTVRDISQAGPVLDAAFAAGANSAGNIQFGLKDPAAPYNQALAAAAAATRPKAEAMATAMGVTIVALQSVQETSQAAPQNYARSAVASAPMAAAPPTPIQPGEQTVTARVTAVYTFR